MSSPFGSALDEVVVAAVSIPLDLAEGTAGAEQPTAAVRQKS